MVSVRTTGSLHAFISYATHDRALVDRLLTQLRPVREEFGLDIFQDSGIGPGSTWDSHIMDAIASADVFIVCLSPAFLASQYCYYVELPAIRRRANEAGAVVVPVMLERCAWWGWVDDWEVVPTSRGRSIAITDWKTPDAGMRAAVKDIRRAIAVYLGQVQPVPEPAQPLAGSMEDLNALGPGKHSADTLRKVVAEVMLRRRKAASDA